MNYKMLCLIAVLTWMLNAGDYFLKLATKGNHTVFCLCMTAMLWVASIPGWYYTLLKTNLALVGMMFATLSLLTTTAMGIFLFNERLGGAEYIGFALVLISIVLLSNKL